MAGRWGNAPPDNRWGVKTVEFIRQEVIGSIPINTRRGRRFVWTQFEAFCTSRTYELVAETSVEQLAAILQDWAWNMKKSDGEDYKESVVRMMWNVTAKMLQEKYCNDFRVMFNPFKDELFKAARDARDAKRRELQDIPEKRTVSTEAFTEEELADVLNRNVWDEDTPDGLQRKFFHIATMMLGWKASDAAFTHLEHFVSEVDEYGRKTGRIEYNTLFVKTPEGGTQSCTTSKFLTPDTANPNNCPVRLFNKLIQHRPLYVTTNRVFLTPNRFWKVEPKRAWYKNMPIGKFELSRWTRQAAEKIGIDRNNRKNSGTQDTGTDDSEVEYFSTEAPVSQQERQLPKRTVHRSTVSIKTNLELDIPLLQTFVDQIYHPAPIVVRRHNFLCEDFVDQKHHPTPIVISNQDFLCEDGTIRNVTNIPPISTIASVFSRTGTNTPKVVFNNCTFYLNLKQ